MIAERLGMPDILLPFGHAFSLVRALPALGLPGRRIDKDV
jgi:hypothetical protein